MIVAQGVILRINRGIQFLLIILFSFLLVGDSYSGQNTIECTLVLCKSVVGNLPRDIAYTFNTDESIFAYLYLDCIDNGQHKVDFYWYKGDSLKESCRRKINVRNGAYNVWSWLKLNEAEALYDTGFVGEWKVKVYIDNEFLEEKYFSVI